jgi:hypothetical protein
MKKLNRRGRRLPGDTVLSRLLLCDTRSQCLGPSDFFSRRGPVSLRWREGPQGRSRNQGGKDLSWGSTGLAAGLAGLVASSTSSLCHPKGSSGAVRSVTGFILEIVDLDPGTVQGPSNARPRQVLGKEQKTYQSKTSDDGWVPGSWFRLATRSV